MEFLITISDSYSEPALLLMYSVYRNMGAGHVFHFIHKNISSEHQERMRCYAENKCKAQVHFVEFHDERFSKLPLYGVWSEEIYYRLFAAYLLPNVDKVLYLDGDTIVTGDVASAWESVPADQYAFGAVANDVQKEHKERLGLTENDTYVNSGVIFMNLNRIRELYTEQEMWGALLESSARLQFPDQDFLNITFQKEINLLDIRYNYMINVTERRASYPKMRDYRICHFVLSKPWSEEFLYKTDRVYLTYLAESGQMIKAAYLYYAHRKRRWVKNLKSILKLR